ncbi:hypothetical protein OU994_07555 [Pseudoduganella sp. SL102]|uniref:hypothetical protein n=1 Tax=Pseudoduganella sp. SL102 TaxID=2995154 RepID=UPI00248AC22A|nr:hypothetical protein [Pseudoduganella sp. SL102]WBS04130.1 hypothetical protein OU994_07555 [Pseudoduganella sp. SL102]
MSTASSPTAGIEISSKKLHLALFAGGKLKVKAAENSPFGVLDLIDWMRRQKVVPGQAHVCITSGTGQAESVALWLRGQGVPNVSLVEPAALRESVAGNPVDKIDASALARYCAAANPPLWVAPPEEVFILRAMCKNLADMRKLHVSQTALLGDWTDNPDVTEPITNSIQQVEEQITRSEELIKQLLTDYPHLVGRPELAGAWPPPARDA